MNPESNAIPGSPLQNPRVEDSQVQERRVEGPAKFPTSRVFYWSVRRELWEYKSIYIAPLAVAGIMLLGYLFATMGYALSTTDLARRRTILEEPFHFATALVIGAAYVAAFFYCLDALHGERRDRSILFWKSLPVSDTMTVLSKASIPFVVVPVLALAVTFALHLLMLLMGTAAMMGSGIDAGNWWAQTWNFDVDLIYHMVTVHVLWYAPIYTWLLLVSGWAKRAAFLWAGLPPLALFGLEWVAFRTKHVAAVLIYRLSGPVQFSMDGSTEAHAMAHSGLGQFLITPGLWGGFILAGIFLWLAVRLRRSQGPL